MPRLRPTIALRLTLWYATVFSASFLLGMVALYSSVAGLLRSETDGELRQDLEETASLVDRGGVEAFRQELGRELAGPDSLAVFLRLWPAAGPPVASAGFEAPDDEARRAVARQRADAGPTLLTLHPASFEHPVRVGYARTEAGLVVEFGQSLEEVERHLAALRNGMLGTLPIVILLGGPIGWFMARRALRGVGIVTRAALEIADGAMDRRVPVGSRDDELDRLALAFNTMLDRIGGLIDGMREMTDNLAHDLRTPLARVRASAERAAARTATREEWTTLAGTTIDECDRMLQILNGTLEIAEAQAGAAPLRIEDVDLAELLEQARDLFVTLAEDAGVTLELEAPRRCTARVDRSRVQRIVANLLDNAIKYTPAGGRISISLAEEGRWVRIDVKDTGIGVPAGDLPRIFERFYRVDGSRSGRGSGLGLSLARAFARAHGGDLTAASAPGRGSTFTLRLRSGGGASGRLTVS
jgi:signal transduction histidine kinase